MMKQEWLKGHFKYSKGALICKKKHSKYSSIKVGQSIGSLDDGYLKVFLLGKLYKVHHLVWLYFKGSFPAKGSMIDHKNMIRHDNRIRNLRLSSMSQNQSNKHGYDKTRKCRYKGVVKNSNSKNFSASICVNKRKVHLGSFDTQEKAAIAYNKAAKRLHGKFARLNIIKGEQYDA